jgi:hypothetical protein
MSSQFGRCRAGMVVKTASLNLLLTARRASRSLIARMGRDQHIIDELKRFERLCLELAEKSTLPEGRAGLEIMAGNYQAEIERLSQAVSQDAACISSAPTEIDFTLLRMSSLPWDLVAAASSSCFCLRYWCDQPTMTTYRLVACRLSGDKHAGSRDQTL